MSTSASNAPPVAERNTHPYLTYDMIQEIPATIEKTIEQTNNRLDAISGKLRKRSSLFFTGCGTAFFSSMLGSNVLTLRGQTDLDVECVQALELANHYPIAQNSVTFAVSHSGITKTTIEALRKAKAAGSYTLGITHFADRPIGEVADETLVVGNGPDKSRCHTKCYPAGALPLMQIGIETLAQRGLAQTELLGNVLEGLKRLPALARRVLASTEPIMKDLAQRNAGKQTFYFAGTGGSYSNALEAALKIMETSYIPAQGFETEQLLHGPWVSLDERSVLFVMATEARTRERSEDLLRAATSLGSTVVSLVGEEYRQMASLCRNTINLPTIDEHLAPYLSIIPLYLFAYYLCIQRGHNPDYLRYLTPAYWGARTIIFPPGTH